MVTDKVKARVRKAIEALYHGVCTITNHQETVDKITGVTSFEEVEVCKDEPCRLSYSNLSNVNQTDTVGNVAQVIKLFVRPELIVKVGSKITVTQSGRTTVYVASGQSALYDSHQEILLTLEDKTA